jgi:hypothetical protein
MRAATLAAAGPAGCLQGEPKDMNFELFCKGRGANFCGDRRSNFPSFAEAL